jgi:tetratricopeptide (TPR) repeat protein
VSPRRTRLIAAGLVVLVAALLGTGLVVRDVRGGSGPRYFETGRRLLESGDPRLGLTYVATALAIAPSNFGIQTYFLAVLDQDRFKDDLQLHESLRLLLPQYPPLMERLAKLYEGTQQQAAAGQVYEEWQSLRPENAEPHAEAGEHYRFAGQDRKAIEAFSQYMDVVEESDYATRRIAESAAKVAAAVAVAAAVGVAMRDSGR